MVIIRRQSLFLAGTGAGHLLSDRMVLDLVEHIYAAGCDPEQWKTFVDRVHDAVPGSAFSVHLSIEGTALTGSAAGIPPEQVESYFAHYHTINPYNDLFRKIPVGQVHTVSGLVPEGWLDRHIFYHEWQQGRGGGNPRRQTVCNPPPLLTSPTSCRRHASGMMGEGPGQRRGASV